ncbi:MAG: hypothetical protein E6I13_15120 [Chloroflexi bacterium]|nr:MAG: hypothetical protein E6I13_15120 [Chloroflexota bacterium]
MQRDDHKECAEDDDNEDQLLQHDVPALLLVAQPQVVQPARDYKSRPEQHAQTDVLPELHVGKQ